MMQFRHEKGAKPTDQLLAAYVDGELDAASHGQVEAWLADHPEAAAEVTAMQHLRKVWQTTAPPEPSAREWSQMLDSITAALPSPPVTRKTRVSAGVLGWTAVTLAAASLLLAFFLQRPTIQDSGTGSSDPSAEEQPFEVATISDVEIHQIDHDDLKALVVGTPPVPELLEVASKADVSVDSVEPAEDGSYPDMRLLDHPNAPMVWMPRGQNGAGNQKAP